MLVHPCAGAAFFVTGSLSTPRESHTATLLPNGQVLVAGGFNNGSELASAELFNPATGSWTPTGKLNTPRDSHTATLLPNGQVLVAGGNGNGSGSGSYLASVELFNPATGSWTPTGNLNILRAYQTATLLPNGQVLVAGGDGNLGPGGALRIAELFNPAAGSWTPTGNLNTPRASHTATLLPNGQVLVAGGFNNGSALASAELFNSATGSWTPTGNLNSRRDSHTATLLPNGQVLVAGGYGSGSALASAELYDSTATPTPTPTPPPAPVATAATGIGFCQFTANWTSVAGATGYRLDVFTGYPPCDQLNVDVGNVTSHLVGEGAECGGFQYLVRAYNASGTSPNSNTIIVNNPCSGTPTPTPTPTPVPVRFANISTRASVGTDDNVLIAGFIITGVTPLPVIVRAIGPSLTLPGVLSDPVLEIHDSSGGTIAENDNWRDTQEAEIVATGIPPADNAESAIVMSLGNGSYTAIVTGKNSGTGIALVEVYDLSQTVLTSRLANVSTRGFAQTGDDVMIGGLIVVGTQPANAIARALGPSLPVADPLVDPTLELHDGDGAIIASNDNWKDTQEAEIIATGIPPTNDAESAIVATLPPGNYTAIVRGKNDTTGVALVEAYQLDN